MKWFIVVLLLSFTISAYCNEGISESTECFHVWESYDLDIHGPVADEIVLMQTDQIFHVYIKRVPQSVCTICGQYEYSPGTGNYTQHSYEVKQWSYAGDGDEVRVTYACRICDYEKTEQVVLQAIVQGTETDCLFGGRCDGSTGYMTDHKIITAGDISDIVGEREVFLAVIYDSEMHTFLFASREYCPRCGRPRVCAHSYPTTDYNENLNGLPIMTEEYFLNVDMPDNMPYQLIDQLRKEAGAA